MEVIKESALTKKFNKAINEAKDCFVVAQAMAGNSFFRETLLKTEPKQPCETCGAGQSCIRKGQTNSQWAQDCIDNNYKHYQSEPKKISEAEAKEEAVDRIAELEERYSLVEEMAPPDIPRKKFVGMLWDAWHESYPLKQRIEQLEAKLEFEAERFKIVRTFLLQKQEKCDQLEAEKAVRNDTIALHEDSDKDSQALIKILQAENKGQKTLIAEQAEEIGERLVVYLATNKVSSCTFESREDAELYAGNAGAADGIRIVKIDVIPKSQPRKGEQ